MSFAESAVISIGQAAQGVYGAVEQCAHLFAAAKGGSPCGEGKLLERGSTANLSNGTTLPRNLEEQLAVEEAMANPKIGIKIEKIKMNDPRWPASEGWVKRQHIHTSNGKNINVHYVHNKITGMADDFKIKIIKENQ